jgi:hypothetical protein
MRNVRRARGIAVALVATLGLGVAGCGSTSLLPGHRTAGSCAGHRDQDGPAAPAATVGVICRWSAALRAGDLSAAAGYFRLPSVFENGPSQVVAIHTRAQAESVNATLSCGAKVISAFRQGRYVNVLFRLTARAGPGGGRTACGSGVGLSARTVFLIRDGQIEQWLRAASRPGDPGTPQAPTTTSTQSGGSTI